MRFEKVSKAEYAKHAAGGYAEYDELRLPKRQTAQAAGYDFYFPGKQSISLQPGEDALIPTFVKASIDPNWALLLLPRSSLGFKFYARLANTTGLIDADYYGNPSNEGHIFVKIRNEGSAPLTLKPGDRFCQGVFIPFGTTVDDDASEKRVGGFGSTDESRRKADGECE